MFTARLSAPCSSVRARSRAAVDVHAVANPTSKTATQPSKGATPVQKQQEKPCAPSRRPVVEENTLHNSFYLPYHCVYQHNVIVELPAQAKTPDAFDSSWSGSSYL